MIYGDDFEINLLNERCCIETDNLSITVTGDGLTDLGFYKSPYFKIYSGRVYETATKLTRISMIKPEYIIHNNDIWTLNSREIKFLINLLNSKHDMYIWEKIKYEASILASKSDKCKKEDIYYINSLPIPDYTKLHYTTAQIKKYGNLLK